MRKMIVLVLLAAACGGCVSSEHSRRMRSDIRQGFRDMGHMAWHFALEPR